MSISNPGDSGLSKHTCNMTNNNFGFSVPLDKNGGLNRDESLLDVVLTGLQCS